MEAFNKRRKPKHATKTKYKKLYLAYMQNSKGKKYPICPYMEAVSLYSKKMYKAETDTTWGFAVKYNNKDIRRW